MLQEFFNDLIAKVKYNKMLQQFNPKNKDIQVFVKEGLCHRKDAKVSVFDSSVQGGDAVWEGLRVYKGGIFCLDKHLERLYASAKSLAFTDIPDLSFIKCSLRYLEGQRYER